MTSRLADVWRAGA